VPDEAAAFTVIGAIALQGIRLAQPTLGESIVVTGLGLVGQITVQLLRAHGCRVLGIDLDPSRLELARRYGAETVDLKSGQDPVAAADRFSRGPGVDAVVVTAASESSEPIHQAALMCRKRGRIVLVGVTGLALSRDDFYKKELSFQVSCSYGPGRYDPAYEDRGQDYPVGFVRWTAQRNFEAVLDTMAAGRLDVSALVSHRFPLDRAESAYAVVSGGEPSLGILLEYPSVTRVTDENMRVSRVAMPAVAGRPSTPSAPAVAFVGSGNYATALLIPAFKAAGARLATVVSSRGLTGVHAARKFGFDATTTDASSVFHDEKIDLVVVATRHDSHASFVLQALESGKPIFVEKPLCLSLDELAVIEAGHARAARTHQPLVMVGFNRRFAPQIQKIKALLAGAIGPKSFIMTVNAGQTPASHWTQDPTVGGGRVVGEACHFVDLLRFLAGSPIVSHARLAMASPAADTVSLQLGFGDGSIGTVHYFANGPKSLPKERLEVFAQGRALQLDNFRVLRGFGWPGFKSMRLWRQDKGQAACAAACLRAVRDRAAPPIPFDEVLEISRVTIELATPS
jgi:predicted dehydrogenase